MTKAAKSTATPAAGTHTYPRSVMCNGTKVELALLGAQDEADLLAFAQSLPEHDLLFLKRDISQPAVVRAWMRAAVDEQHMPTLLARAGGRIIGCTALIHDPLSWSKHVGELRAVVGEEARGIGLGRHLIQEGFAQALALGLEKVVAYMTTDQRGAIALFESLGFRPEALLAAHVHDRSGRKHDVVMLSHDVAVVGGRMAVLGLGE